MKPVSLACSLALLAGSAAALEIDCGPSAPERRAGAELKTHLARLAEETPDLVFRIGVDYLKLFPADAAALAGTDGYAVRRKDGAIYIVSPVPRGCIFGVTDFLERNSDIIWARPDEECGTICTRRKTFEAREADFVERPKFVMRGWWFCGPQRHAPSEYWHSRVRCNFGCANLRYADVLARAVETGSLVGGAAGHNLPQYIPDALYDTHPEYFALISGARRRDSSHTQFCFSNLDGADVVGETAVGKIAEKLAEWKASVGVTFDHWALKQADNTRLCECAACAADIPLPDGRVSRKDDENFRSNQTFLYLNRAMEKVAAAYPEMRVDTFGYQFTAPPPDVKVHEKLNVAFCPFIKNDRFSVTSEVNRVWQTRAEKWAKATKNIMWREYWGCASGFPRQHSPVAAEDLKWINGTLGFTRVYSETMPDDARTGSRWDASAMEHWVLSRLMWNPYVPVDIYREQYVTRTYRKAAAPMRTFYALLRESWFADDTPTNYTDDPYGNAARYIVRAGLAEKLLALLDEAGRLAADDVPEVRRLLARQKAHFADLVTNASNVPAPEPLPLVKDGDWSKAAVFDGFCKVSRSLKEARTPAVRKTEVRAMHDGKTLHVRFACADPDPARLEAKALDPGEKGKFPGGDHVEFALSTKKGRVASQFGVDCNGNCGVLVNGKAAPELPWRASVKRTATGYEVTASVEWEAVKAELTMENRFGIAFARMATPRASGEKREFSSWRGVHPQATTVFGEIFVKMD